MSKVESFYWNKLSNESLSVESEQFFDFCFVWLPSGAFTLMQDESQHYGKSNFPGKGTEPIQKLFGKFERLSDALF